MSSFSLLSLYRIGVLFFTQPRLGLLATSSKLSLPHELGVLVETQAIQQEKLRHGGVVVVHGKSSRGNQSNVTEPNKTICMETSHGQQEGTPLSGHLEFWIRWKKNLK